MCVCFFFDVIIDLNIVCAVYSVDMSVCAPFRGRGVEFRFRNDLSKEYMGFLFYFILFVYYSRSACIRGNNKSRKVLEPRGTRRVWAAEFLISNRVNIAYECRITDATTASTTTAEVEQ